MLSLLLFLVVLGILILVHEFGHFIVAKKSGIRVEKFSLGFGPVLFKKKQGDTEYAVSAFPLGGYVKMAGDIPEECVGKSDEFYSKPPIKRFAVIFCGPLLNYLMGILLLWLVFVIGYPAATTKIASVLDDYGAKEAGILPGDRIVAIDGVKVNLWEDLQAQILSRRDPMMVKVDVMRENKIFTADVKIKAQDFKDIFGKTRSLGLLGIGPSDDFITVKHRPVESVGFAVLKTWDFTVITYKGLWLMITGKLPMRKSMTGPLGIFYLTSKTAKLGLAAFLNFMAVLSISLGIFNLLPLPVLDGGHILLLAVEKIRGRRLSVKADQFVTNAGLFLIISLALFATYNDIMRLYGDKISKIFIKN